MPMGDGGRDVATAAPNLFVNMDANAAAVRNVGAATFASIGTQL